MRVVGGETTTLRCSGGGPRARPGSCVAVRSAAIVGARNRGTWSCGESHSRISPTARTNSCSEPPSASRYGVTRARAHVRTLGMTHAARAGATSLRLVTRTVGTSSDREGSGGELVGRALAASVRETAVGECCEHGLFGPAHHTSAEQLVQSERLVQSEQLVQ